MTPQGQAGSARSALIPLAGRGLPGAWQVLLHYKLTDSSGLLLDGRGSTTASTIVGQWYDTGSTNLQWLIVRIS